MQNNVDEELAQGPCGGALELDSNSRPLGRKATNLPMSRQAPQRR